MYCCQNLAIINREMMLRQERLAAQCPFDIFFNIQGKRASLKIFICSILESPCLGRQLKEINEDKLLIRGLPAA